MQIRYMEQHPPPVRLIAPGRVYRRDDLDLTHSPMFTQVEGLVVGEDISLADLKGTLFALLRELFGAERKLRFRPSFFPYTEPSAEVDISCGSCGGTGINCGMCKRTGWVEILGSGMVHPAVFEAVGLRPRAVHGLCLRPGDRARRAAEVGRRGHPSVLRERSALPGAVPAVRLVYNWLREIVPVTADVDTVAREIGLRGFEVAGVEYGREPVIDFEITANRPDCLSHIGLAREASAIWGLPCSAGRCRSIPVIGR